MIREEPVQYVEIDFDQCTLTWGTGTCTAALSASTPNKCRNTWNTCGLSRTDRETIFNKGTLTLRFIKPRNKMPVDGRHFFPTLKSVSAFSSTVNIVGFKQEVGSLGRRGSLTVVIGDTPYNDKETDPYSTERVSGDAQFNGIGYNPLDKSSLWPKLRQWSPNYSNRAIRVVNTTIYLLSDGTPVWSDVKETRNFVISDIKYDYNSKEATIEGKDILTLAEKESAVAPKPNTGVLFEEITDSATELTLSPSGIGNSEYPASGYAKVGSEIVQFTRSGDTVTLVKRGLFGTEASSHNEGDTFQKVLRFSGVRIHEVVETLLSETSINPDFYNVSDYQTEVIRWASTLVIDTVISEPTAVIKLLGELVTLGVSMWWDDVTQEIKLRMNHPLDFDEVAYPITDDGNIKSLEVVDKDEERITQVHFYSVQANPTRSLTDKSNYDRIQVIFDADAQNENSFGDTRIKEIFCRWLNVGNTAAINIIGRRYLYRFNKAPKYHSIVLDAKDASLSLAKVISLRSNSLVDDNGDPLPTNLQVISKTEIRNGHEVKYVAQDYEFGGARSYILPNDANVYGSATDLEKNNGCYIVSGTTLEFSDGREPYGIM